MILDIHSHQSMISTCLEELTGLSMEVDWTSTPELEHIKPVGFDSIERYSQFDNSLFSPKLYLLVFLPIISSDSENVVVTPPSRVFIALRQ